MKNTLVIVPAFNEEKSVAKVVERIQRECPFADVLVVNDCSTDRTEEVLRVNKINHIQLTVNLGIGGAMQTGYIYAFKNGYEFAVQIDGDGQHEPAEVSKLFRAMETEGADLVIGSRFVTKTGFNQSFMRKIGINIFKLVTTVLTGQSVADATSGFRLANRKVITVFSKYYPTDYPEPEVLVYLDKFGFKVKEVAVKMNNRETGKSSITPLKSAYYMAKVVMSMLVMKLRGVEYDRD
jgi:glycosyltransferase involved in cell wall biosynthesis